MRHANVTIWICSECGRHYYEFGSTASPETRGAFCSIECERLALEERVEELENIIRGSGDGELIECAGLTQQTAPKK
jgi:hypothetical protein